MAALLQFSETSAIVPGLSIELNVLEWDLMAAYSADFGEVISGTFGVGVAMQAVSLQFLGAGGSGETGLGSGLVVQSGIGLLLGSTADWTIEVHARYLLNDVNINAINRDLSGYSFLVGAGARF